MWPGIPATYQNLPESDCGSSRYNRSRDYQTPTRHALLGHQKRDYSVIENIYRLATQPAPNNRNLRTIAQLCRAVSMQLRHISTIGKKNLLNSNIFSVCPHNMVNFGPVTAEIGSGVWGTPANFSVLAALLYGTLVVGVSQTLRHWTEGATCIRQGGHHVGHWPTF